MKKISLLLLILFSILLVSCEAESYVVEKKPEAISLQDLKFRTVPFNQVGSKFNQISQELELNKHLVGLVKNNGLQQREATVNGIEIIDGLVNEITNGEYTSYTMLIKSEETTNKFYNLVIERIGQLTKLAVVKYEPTEQWMLTKGEFKGEVTTFRINDLQTTIGQLEGFILGNGSGGGNTTYPTDCNGYVVSTTVVTETFCGCNDHSWQQLVNGTCTCDDTPSLETTTYYECIEFGTPNEPGTGNPSSPGGYITGYPIGSTPTSSQNNVSTLTMPFSKDEIIKMFYYELSPEQLQWWKDENNSDSRAEIEAYIVNQPNVELAFEFAKELMNLDINNTLITPFPLFKYPLNSNYTTLYPNFTILIKEYIPSLKTDQRLINTIHKLTNVNKQYIIDKLTWGNGPEINIVQLGNDPQGNEYHGRFNITEPDKIFIDIDLVNQLEQMSNISNPTQQQQQQLGMLNALVVFSVCLHEYIHYSDFAFDGSMQDNENLELGLLFEELFLGGYYEFSPNGNIVFIKAN